MARKKTNYIDIQEIEAVVSKGYSIEKQSEGVYIFDGWLFLWPKSQKWGERYKNRYGYYDRGNLLNFIKEAENYKLTGEYFIESVMRVEVK